MTQSAAAASANGATDAMKKEATWLLDRRRNVFSQTGEDGIIEAILEPLPARDRWCVEFGAWDGLYLSNTRNLIENAGYSAVLIEGSTTKFVELQRNYAGKKDVHPVNAYVGFTAADGLDTILAKTPIPHDFDLLSIDVDGNDYHVWKAIARYRPKAVCIEFNPTVPTEVRFVQPADPNVSQGNSLLSLVELGKEKGYELVCVTLFNAFFVDARYYPLFGIDDNRPENLRKDLSGITYLFSGFDGTIFLQGNRQLPWHNVPLKESAIQHLPKMLRKYPGNYTRMERIGFRLFEGLSSPVRSMGRLYRHMKRRFGYGPSGPSDGMKG